MQTAHHRKIIKNDDTKGLEAMMADLKFSVNVTVNYEAKILQGKHKNWVLLGLDDTRRSGM